MKRALILGGANCLQGDRQRALEMFEPDVIIACNHAGIEEPHVDHMATMHPELLRHWHLKRMTKGHPPWPNVWHAKHRKLPADAPAAQPIESWGGSSGMLCVVVALAALNCDRVVLAGVPMSKTFRHFDDDRLWLEARQYWTAWEKAAETKFNGRVRSMSGWTGQLLGWPTKDWLYGNTQGTARTARLAGSIGKTRIR